MTQGDDFFWTLGGEGSGAWKKAAEGSRSTGRPYGKAWDLGTPKPGHASGRGPGAGSPARAARCMAARPPSSPMGAVAREASIGRTPPIRGDGSLEGQKGGKLDPSCRPCRGGGGAKPPPPPNGHRGGRGVRAAVPAAQSEGVPNI